MVDSGQYVFFNMENIQNLNTFKPWHDEEASDEENSEAMEAFHSVFTLNLGIPHSSGNLTFTHRVKELARTQFGFDYKEDVSTLAENFYDAALVYSKGEDGWEGLMDNSHSALNETLMKEQPDLANLKEYGTNISRNMISMNITGATGD